MKKFYAEAAEIDPRFGFTVTTSVLLKAKTKDDAEGEASGKRATETEQRVWVVREKEEDTSPDVPPPPLDVRRRRSSTT